MIQYDDVKVVHMWLHPPTINHKTLANLSSQQTRFFYCVLTTSYLLMLGYSADPLLWCLISYQTLATYLKAKMECMYFRIATTVPFNMEIFHDCYCCLKHKQL